MYQWNSSRVSKGHLNPKISDIGVNKGGKIISVSEGLQCFVIILIAFSNAAGLWFGVLQYQQEGLEIDICN